MTEDRWQKRPPVSGMSIEEMKKRVAAGIENRRRQGLLPRADLPALKTRPSGPTLDKKQRRVMIGAANLAIYSLANDEREDYCGACEVMNAVRRQAGMTSQILKVILTGVAEQAAELRGESFQFVDQLARTWLDAHFKPSGKLISITRGKQHGIDQEKAKN